ncbi:hypothetical protein Tco_0915213 [Tanacetum coccineum]
MAQQSMRSEEELCPTNMRFVPNRSNVMFDLYETQDEPLFDISLEILKHPTIYNAITLTTEVPKIYIHQFCILKKSLPGKASGVDRAKEPIVQILWGIVNSANVDFAELIWEDFSVGEKERLEKLKYVANGEPRGKLTFEMPIPKAMMSREIKESNAYVNYLAKYPHAQSRTSTPRKGLGKGYMRKGDMKVNAPTPKKKKDAVPRRSRTIAFADNLLEDQDQALDYAKLVNEEENQQRENERRNKQRHVGIMLEKQVNKEVDEGYKHLKVKLKAQEQPSPEAQLLLNLKKQSKKSKKQRHLEEIRKAPRENSDSDNGDDNDKSNNEDESTDSDNDDSEKDSDNDEDQAADFMIHPRDKEPVQTQKEPQLHSPSVTTTSAEDSTTMTVTPILETIQKTHEEPTENVIECPPSTLPTKIKKKRAKTLLQKAIEKKNDWKKVVKQRLDDHHQKRLNTLS